MRRPFKLHGRARPLSWAATALLALCFGQSARADLILDISSAVGANVEFKGSGTGATFVFNNNGSGNGFTVTNSSGFGDSVGLDGTIGGSYSYLKASIVTVGPSQTALVTTSGGSLTITDASSLKLIGTVNAVDVNTLGTSGSVNVSGAINLSGVTYSGTNKDLTQLKNEADANGGTVVISFQFIPAISLTGLTASGADHATSYSGTISTAIPEPTSLVLGSIALGLVGFGVCRSKARGD
jgi:hypothetical protein